jgi:hypothetical protein
LRVRELALGKTPAEAAGIDLKLGRNAWLGLVKLSAKIFILVHLLENETNPRSRST